MWWIWQLINIPQAGWGIRPAWQCCPSLPPVDFPSAKCLGAGWGFLSHEIASRFSSVERLDLFEADTRALDCAKQNLATFPEVARFHWHDVAAGLGEVGYDAIVMNPPFHTGQNTDVGLGKAFIHAASNALKRGGRLFVVANRQLPYEAELTAAGFAWRKPVEDATFKLLFAEKR